MKGQHRVLLLLPKTATDVAKNFRSCKGRSQLSVDIFMASRDLLAAQECPIQCKMGSKSGKHIPIPPWSPYAAIYIQISWFRPIIGHMVLRPHANTLGLFPVKNATAYRPSYLPYAIFCVLVPFCQNRVFLQSMIYKGKNSLIEYSTQNILKV